MKIRGVFALVPLFLIVFMQMVFIVSAHAQVGATVSHMIEKYGSPTYVPLKNVAGNNLAKYQKSGVTAYRFNILYKSVMNNLKFTYLVTALFNGNGICFEEYTNSSTATAESSLLLGALAGTKRKLLARLPMVYAKLKYGNGKNAVIYETVGGGTSGSSRAYSPALMPK